MTTVSCGNRGLRWKLQRRVLALPALLSLLVIFSPLNAQQNRRAEEANVFAPQQTAAALKTLSSHSQMVVERLSAFAPLAITEWRYHAGNVPNAQSVAFDDSSWQSSDVVRHATPAGKLPSDSVVVWLRKTIEIPRNIAGYDLTGDTVSLRIMVHAYGGDGALMYINGDPIPRVDPSEPSIVYQKPGDKVVIAIRIRWTATPTGFPVARMQVEYSSQRPSPEDLYTEFVSAALMLPHLPGDRPGQKASLEKAIADIDIDALSVGNQQKFDASLRRSQQDLEPLKPVLQSATFHLSGNSHIDAAWLWPWTETVDIVKRTFSTALELMDEYPTYTYTQSAVQYNEWIAEKYPLMNAEIKKRVQEGRWEVVGGMWVEPDLNMPDGESQVRQLLVGQRTLQKLYGVTTRIGWNPDTFGYDWQLPQIYKKSGIDYFVTQKLAANETNPYPFKLFWWEAPDGSKVLTYFPHSYSNNDLSPLRLDNDLIKAQTLAPGMLQMMDLYGVGDHGGGPTRVVLEQGLHWMQPDKVAPKMEFGTAQSYFTGIEKKIADNSPMWNYQVMGSGAAALPAPPPGEVSIPTWKDELYFEHHRGTYTTQADHKRNMRESEEWMLNAEKFSSLAWLDGNAYPAAELTEAWKKVLFNQFHDLAAGSGVADTYKDARRDYDQVRWAAGEASSKALDTIQAHVDTHAAGDVPILVFNPLAWDRSGIVQVNVEMPVPAGDSISVVDGNNRVLPSEVLSRDERMHTYRLLVKANEIPSLGYAVWHVVSGKKPFASDVKATGTTIENAFLKVSVDPHDGCITSIYDKRAKFEALAAGACGNQLQTFKDMPVTDDAWNIDPGVLDHATPLTKADSVVLVESTPFRAVVRVARRWRSSTFVQDITLYAASDEVDIVTDIDWHETHSLLKAAFPLAASSRMATYEIPYGTIERPTTRATSWDEAKFEVPALRWADLGDGQHGFSLLNEVKYGYDCKDNVLRLTLLRSPTSPDPTADRGHNHFSYALYPHAGDWKSALTVRHGYNYNYKLTAMQVRAHAGTLPLEHSFFAVHDDNLVLTAVKKAEDADGLILHLYEWAGKDSTVEIDVPPGARSATRTNLMETPEGKPLPIESSSRVNLPVHPYEIMSVRIDYPNKDHQ